MPGREWKKDPKVSQGERDDESAVSGGNSEGEVHSGRNSDVKGRSFKDVKVGVNGPFNKSKVVAGVGARVIGPDNGSDEEILGMEYKRNSQRKSASGAGNEIGEGDLEMGLGNGSDGHGGSREIHVRETWRVTRS